ncbi:MAG: carbohydrate kinase family protein [Longimicrobiales bacterium]
MSEREISNRPLTIGVVGTMVWDRIHARDVRAAPIEEWGGISYALAGVSAAAQPAWVVRPLIRVGSDLSERAFHFFRSIPGLDTLRGVQVIPEPNNRVELRYIDRERRTERLTGGVGPWTWAELEPLVADLDALYINFISGFELELETAQRLRLSFRGPIYADLHSLMLGVDVTGMRVPRPLEAWREWLRCFDIVQVNEEELTLLAQAWGDPWRFAAEMVNDELRLLLVTLGPRGTVYFSSPSFRKDPLSWRTGTELVIRPAIAGGGPVKSERIPPPDAPAGGDPTGCGDVWGGTFFCKLLAGHTLNSSIRSANTAAARNVEHHGATGLREHLLGKLAT